MNKERRYSIGRNLSFLYIVYAFVSLVVNTSFLGTLFFIIVFPVVLMSLNKLLDKEYLYPQKIIFTTTEIILIISTLTPKVGMAIMSTIVDINNLSSENLANQNIVKGFVNVTNSLLLARGIILLVLSLFLIKKIMEFRMSL